MQIKHTFLLALVLGLACAGILFAVSPLVQATPQITSISKTPNPPLAGQVFNFTITGSNFALSNATAVFTGPGCAAGCQGTVATIVPTEVTGTAQLDAGNFTVVVRNGSSGPASNSVSLAVTTAVPFTITNLGGTTRATDGGGNLALGYARIHPSSGNTTPSGVLIFGYRLNNVLVTESGVPASPSINAGRMYAKVSANSGAASVNTGIAIVNPNSAVANINFHFANTAGDIVSSGTCVIAPNRGIGQFLNESSPCPFNMGSIQGTFTFTSNVPVAAIALRSYIPEDGNGVLYSTLPVVDTSVATGTDPVYLAHFADGTEWTTEVVLVNPTGNTVTGAMQFFVDGLNPSLPLATDRGTANTFTYSIPRESSYTLKTLGASNPLAVGSVRITPSGTVAPSATLIFSYKPGGVTVAEAGVLSIQGTSFRMYYELSGSGPGSVQSALAVSNVAPTPTTVDFEVYELDGRFVAVGQSQVMLGNGHISKAVDQLFPGVTLPTRGVLRISGGTGFGMSVVGIRSRYNELGKYLFTTTPATNEVSLTPPTGADQFFPRLVNGGSWTTQYVLYSGAVGQTTSGLLQFFDISGGAINLTLN